MENLIRIKLNPQRGGLASFDFIRPCFCLTNWPSDEVEIWISDDGISWNKLDEPDYTASHDPLHRRFYISLLFNITSICYLGFFPGGGNIVGIGYELERHNKIPIGWDIEGTVESQIPGGCSIGSTDAADVQSGYSVEGVLAGNCPAGYRLKFPELACFPIGGWIAAPCDADISIGFGIGICEGSLVGIGAPIMGLCELGGEIIALDEEASDCLGAQAAWRKQKLVQLNGVTPKELD